MIRLGFLGIGLALVLSPIGEVSAASWSRLIDPGGQFVIDVPTPSFRQEVSDKASHKTFIEVDGAAIIDVYAGRNLKRMVPTAFIQELSHAPRIEDITYAAQGRSWFAISGHYVREGAGQGALIYYAKFVFTADLTRFAAFEISYPVTEKRAMDPVVTHLEKSLRLTR
jgi:hypothetical protein